MFLSNLKSNPAGTPWLGCAAIVGCCVNPCIKAKPPRPNAPYFKYGLILAVDPAEEVGKLPYLSIVGVIPPFGMSDAKELSIVGVREVGAPDGNTDKLVSGLNNPLCESVGPLGFRAVKPALGFVIKPFVD